MLLGIIIIIIVMVVFINLFLQQPQFGKLPAGNNLTNIKNSTNYNINKFKNRSFTPDLSEGVSYSKVLKEFIFNKSKRIKPSSILPSQKVHLLTRDADKNKLVWFGHSSYFMQVDGKKILVDPVMSGSASPVKFTTRSYIGSDVYTPNDLPEIDYLFITHDHWDHLDYETIVQLKPKIKKVICGLGESSHLEKWGYDKNLIIEKDWDQEVVLDNNFIVNTATARHFSGRGLKRNQSLWMSYIFTTPTLKIYVGGDSGYDTHFKTIGTKYGPFDLSILECGQYHNNWKYIHMMPEEVVQAAKDLNAKKFLPVHWAKFSLSQHDWDDPIIRVTGEAEKQRIPVLHPMIGEEADLNNFQHFGRWWEQVD